VVLAARVVLAVLVVPVVLAVGPVLQPQGKSITPHFQTLITRLTLAAVLVLATPAEAAGRMHKPLLHLALPTVAVVVALAAVPVAVAVTGDHTSPDL